MNRLKSAFLIFVFMLVMLSTVFSQGVSINNSNTPPDPSAMLDVQSLEQGVLIPRMTEAQRNAIPDPASSLLIYQTNETQGFYYNAGTSASPNWQLVGDNSIWQQNGGDIYRISGRVGIGIDSPEQRLHVAGSIFAQSSNWAIRGVKTGTTGTFPGVWGETESASSGATGVRGFALSTTTSGGSSGVYGRNFALNNFGYGVRGTHDSGGWGVYGETVSGRGVYGFASATTGVNFGVYGQTNSPTGIAVHGVNSAAYVPGTNARAAVFEVSSVHGIAVKGVALSTGNYSTGVIGEVFSTGGTGVKGDASGTNFGYGIWGVSGATGQYAGYFTGQVYITQTLSVNGPSAFVIDHPYDPANKYLSHFSIKSPEPYNLYRGTIILDEGGSAWVRLPDYFDAINIDFSYQLTAVGAPMPDLHIVSTISDGKFQIGGGAPGKQVCWEVTALRNDAYVRDKGYQTEKAKPEYERGTYIYPQGHGQPKELQRDYQRLQQTKGSEANGINQL